MEGRREGRWPRSAEVTFPVRLWEGRKQSSGSETLDLLFLLCAAPFLTLCPMALALTSSRLSAEVLTIQIPPNLGLSLCTPGPD